MHASSSASLRPSRVRAAAPPLAALRSSAPPARRRSSRLVVYAAEPVDVAAEEAALEADYEDSDFDGAGVGRQFEGGAMQGRKFRRSLGSTGRYHRRVLNDEASVDLMNEHGVGYSQGGLVSVMRDNGYVHQEGEITVKLAQSYGFCWGVERAVQMAYEARNQYPDANIHITNEIVHNPTINERLEEMEYNFIMDAEVGDVKDYSTVQTGDVVVLPAFGATLGEMQLLNERETTIVDTTCPWVSKVWNAVDTYNQKDFTSIIHGKYAHEEAKATKSFAENYIVVKTYDEAEYVANYILKGGDKSELLNKFKNAISKGFDPDVHLDHIGIANQTTMLKSETQEIGKLFERTLMSKFGPEEIKAHFKVVDTICDATQERQDAMYELVKEHLDVVLVVGGWNSSNTSHLQEIAEFENIPSYWINKSTCILPGQKILHMSLDGTETITENWLPDGPITVGITSGASTPDRPMEDVMEALFATKADLVNLRGAGETAGEYTVFQF